jgi:hypothetical protein
MLFIRQSKNIFMIFRCLSFVFLSSTLLFLAGCDKTKVEEPLAMVPSLIGKGDIINGLGSKASQSVISNANEWKILVNQFNLDLRYLQEPLLIDTLIDFNKYQVIVVFDSWKWQKGYEIDITDLVENDTAITVSVQYSIPSTNLVIEFPVSPFNVFKIPKTSKRIIFIHQAKPPLIYSQTCSGYLNGNANIGKMDTVIRNKTDWRMLREKMSIGALVDNSTCLPDIDFDNSVVLVSFNNFGCLYPCAFSVSEYITEVRETEKNLVATVQRLDIAVEGGYPQPFCIAIIPRPSKPILFQHR